MCKLVYNKYSPDKKDVSILLSFLCWLLLGFLICFIGISNVFAAEYYINYDTYQRYYDNTGTLTEVDITWNESLQSYISGNLTTVSGSTGAAWLVASPIPMVKGHQYSISFAFVERNNIALSSKNKISISNTVNGAVSSYNNSTYNAETIYSKVTSNTTLSFVFKANSNSSFIVIPFTTTSRVTQNYSVTMFVMEDLGTSGLSQEELNTTINNQTNELNNSIQNSTDTITGEINDMEQSIIDSNKETQDVIKDQFNSCKEEKPELITILNNCFISTDGLATYSTTENLSVHVYKVPKIDTIYSFQFNGYNRLRVSSSDVLYTSCANHVLKQNNILNESPIIGNKYNLTANYEYIYAYFSNDVNNEGGITFDGKEICTNKLDETNDQLGNLNDSLNDSNSTGATNDASNFFSNFTTDTFGLTSVITAPLSLINTLTSSSCSTLNLPIPYLKNKYLELPCMNSIYTRYFGSFFNIYQTITFGIVAYWVIVRIFNQVKDFKNPDHDEIEVLDL